MRINKSTKMGAGFSTRAVLLGIAVLVAASSVAASATVKVTNITLQKLSQFTELTIVCDGPAEFEHQIVTATSDKPYRIVVDVKGAEHGLPQHNFSALPSGMISRIRTSQFSTDPNIVRIVVDAASKLTYKVKDGANLISLHIATPNDDNFTLWSAVPVSQTPELAQAKVIKDVNEEPTKPAGMPAFEGNESNAPKVDINDPAKKDLRMGSKPPVDAKSNEMKAETKANAAKGNQAKAEMKSADAMTTKKSAETASKESASKEPASKQSASEESAAKNAEMPANAEKPTEVAQPSSIPDMPSPDLLTFVYGENSTKPAAESSQKPTESAKPAESKTKETMIDSKATGKPAIEQAKSKTAKSQEAMDSGDSDESDLGAVAESLSNEPVNDEARTKSDRVREKYRSNFEKKDSQQESAQVEDKGKAASASVPQSKIERIREKYKRGIKFSIDEQDERRQEYLDDQQDEEFANTQRNVGPYNEFLPEREIVVYNSGGRVDPFAPLIEDAVAASEPQRLPDVEALRLVGVLLDDGDDRGLFQDFNGYYYILREGDSVKNGYLLAIAEDRATFQIRQYGWNRQVALDLENKF